jgi:glycosyltransferase involved in cell wall biosynthesis
MRELPKTIFVGYGPDMISYYRCFLPAVALGVDYAAWVSDIKVSDINLVTGLGAQPPKLEDLFDYEVVVVQQARGVLWLNLIRELQGAGVTVLYEIDDYVHAARKNKSHELSGQFGAERLRQMELGMRGADGIICSTAYIARRYRAFNPRTWECRNGIDLKRYGWPRPERSGVTIGWAGGVGHKASLARWESAIRNVLRARPEARFVSVGHRAADLFVDEFGVGRVKALPTAGIEVYPASMTLFDVSIAPSAENNQFRGKSDLRWLEASAVGIPLVAHPDVYPDIEDGETGVHASTPDEVEAALLRLIDDTAERERIGATAHAYVSEHRRIEVAAGSWRDVLHEVKTPVVAT